MVCRAPASISVLGLVLASGERYVTKWDVNAGRGFTIGIGLIVFITLTNAALIGVAASRPVGVGTFLVGLSVILGFVLVSLIAYWVYGLAGANYTLDRNALTIHWGTSEQVIPTAAIDRVFTGDEVEGDFLFYGGRWPGHWAGYGELPEAGPTLFYATAPLSEQVLIATPGLTYAISPAEKESFLESLEQRLHMGPTQNLEQSSRRPGILEWAIWHDRVGLALLGSGTLALILLVGVLSLRYPELPILVPLHFASSGSPDRLGPRVEIFLLPLIGLLTSLINGALGGVLYRRHRSASLLLWGSSVLVQILLWTATLGILSRT
jgi:hypothetical protein